MGATLGWGAATLAVVTVGAAVVAWVSDGSPAARHPVPRPAPVQQQRSTAVTPAPAKPLGEAPPLVALPAATTTPAAAAEEFGPPPVLPSRLESSVQVPSFGRYSIKVTSALGTGLQVLDRMSGPGPADGAPGGADGRVDLFLGPGAHKVWLSPPEKGDRDYTVEARPFIEQHQGIAPRLVELRPVEAELGDLQSRSYWLEITARRTVVIEAAGRFLGDLRLWKDGTWLVEAMPQSAVVYATPGKPLAIRRLTADLAPGLYLLSAYGGIGPTWTESGEAKPLFLRWGIPSLPEAGRQRMVAGPFGIDRFLVPAATNYVRLELPEAGPGALTVKPFQPLSALDSDGERRTVDKDAWPPKAELLVDSAGNLQHLVTIERPAGQPYVLQHFAIRDVTRFNGGEYWAGALPAGHGQDDLDSTAVVTEITKEGPERVVASGAVPLTQGAVFSRRFNLLHPVDLFLQVNEPGPYVFTEGDDQTQLTLSLFPDHTVGQPWTGPRTVTLERGIYVLALAPAPERLGIHTLVVRGGRASAEAVAPSPPNPGAVFPSLKLDHAKSYVLRLNGGSGPAGSLLRKLPINLADGLPLVLAAGAAIEVPVTAPAAGRLTAPDEDGTLLPIAVDGHPEAPSPDLTAGAHRLVVRNPAGLPVQASLAFAATMPPLPPLAPEALGRLPVFPVLRPGQPQGLDLARTEAKTYTIEVAEPALYRIESTGLLQTEGRLRTQVAPALDLRSANGIGRNFLLQQYLDQGRYQVTVRTQGETRGHLGLAMAAAPVRDGGGLTPGLAARTTLAAGEGVAYTFDIAQPGHYRLRGLGLGGPYTMRLEDGEGWPILTPGKPADLEQDLRPGRYRAVMLPRPLPGRLVTLLERLPVAVERPGHGPHPLPLDGTVAHRWLEPAVAGAERVPDQWAFTLPAPADLEITVSERIEAGLYRDDKAIAAFDDKSPWKGRLEAGSYHLTTRTVRPNNMVDYTVTVATRQLTVGRGRAITAPATIPVAVGSERVVELASSGPADVRATLFDAHDHMIASDDDRPDDWNFAIAKRLAPGQYTLKVAPVGAATAETTVAMRQWDEVTEAAAAAPAALSVADGNLHIIPLTLAGAGELLVVAAQSADPVGLALERRQGDGAWNEAGTASGRAARVVLARDPKAGLSYRLRVWPLDHTPTPIAVSVQSVDPPAASEGQLAAGLALSPVLGTNPRLGVAAVTLDRPGILRVAAAPKSLRWAGATDRRALGGGPLVLAAGERVWLAADLDETPVLRAERVALEDGAPLALTLPAGDALALPLAAPSRGPLLVVAESHAGQPGLALSEPADSRAMGLAPGVAAAVLPEGGKAVLRLWNAGTSGGDLPVTVRQVGFDPPDRQNLPWGEADGMLPAGTARLLELPAGAKSLRLALPENCAAVLMAGSAAGRTLWAGKDALPETIETTAEKVLLLNAGGGEGRFSLAVGPAEPPTVLAAGGFIKRALGSAGIFRLELAGSGQLRVGGQIESVLAVQSDGTVGEGRPLPLSADATVLVRHQPGLLVAWLDGGGPTAWPPADGAGAVAQAVPAAVPLAGPAMLLRLDAEGPGLLHVNADVPLVAGLRLPGRAAQVRVQGQGAELHLFQAKGGTLLGLQSTHAGPLSGQARISRSEPLPMTEGLGPKLRLAPGDARLFAFTLAEDATIGIGVRGSADSASVSLLDQHGAVLAEGAVAMPKLTAGRYYLLVENRRDGGPAEIQPALVGVERPDRGPPEEIKRQFYQLVAQAEGGQPQ